MEQVFNASPAVWQRFMPPMASFHCSCYSGNLRMLFWWGRVFFRTKWKLEWVVDFFFVCGLFYFYWGMGGKRFACVRHMWFVFGEYWFVGVMKFVASCRTKNFKPEIFQARIRRCISGVFSSSFNAGLPFGVCDACHCIWQKNIFYLKKQFSLNNNIRHTNFWDIDIYLIE